MQDRPPILEAPYQGITRRWMGGRAAWEQQQTAAEEEAVGGKPEADGDGDGGGGHGLAQADCRGAI
jgi:hypothetical protein